MSPKPNGASIVTIKVESLLGIRIPTSDPLIHDNEDTDMKKTSSFDDCDDVNEEPPPSLTATVAFSGSARNMLVRSSMLCIETGLLMVESEPLILHSCTPTTAGTTTTTALSGNTNRVSAITSTLNSQDDDDKNRTLQKFTWSSKDDQPHLVISDIVMPSTRNSPLSSSSPCARSHSRRRRSSVGHDWGDHDRDQPDSSDDRDPVRLLTPTTNTAWNAPSQMIGGSHCQHHSSWSDDAPDILELTVRVGDDKGMAFLVFSGSLGPNDTVCLELPIRRPHASTDSVFTDESRLRLMVQISDSKGPHGSGNDALPTDVPTSVATSTSSASSLSASCQLTKNSCHEDPQKQPRSAPVSPPSAYPMVAPTKSTLEAQIGPLLQKIQRQEQEAWELHRAHKANFIVSLHQSDEAPRRPFRAFCAAAYWNWEHIRELIAACHGASYSNGGGGARNNEFACDSSTIGTHDSWQL